MLDEANESLAILMHAASLLREQANDLGMTDVRSKRLVSLVAMFERAQFVSWFPYTLQDFMPPYIACRFPSNFLKDPSRVPRLWHQCHSTRTFKRSFSSGVSRAAFDAANIQRRDGTMSQ